MRSLRTTGLCLGLILVLATAGCGEDRPGPGAPEDTTGVPGVTWISGASGETVADGDFATWRGTPVTIAGTWNDSFEAQVPEFTLQPGAEYGDWDQDLDVAVGAIWKDHEESWAEAAEGAYDDRWRDTLEGLRQVWSGRPGTLYIRFAHEFNLDSAAWSVSDDEVEDFTTAWGRFRGLQQEIFPASQLVFCPNAETSGVDLDWRDAFPGADQVDVEAVDFYNQYPFVSEVTDFDDGLDATDDDGAPRGLEAHRRFAEEQGLPFAVPEWSSNAEMGDGDVWMAQFHRWLADHAGTGPGQVLYEIAFNVGAYGDRVFSLYPDSRQPRAATVYRDLW